MDNDYLYLLALLDLQLAVYSHFSKQIKETVQYNEKSNSISHSGQKVMLNLFFTNSMFSSCF